MARPSLIASGLPVNGFSFFAASWENPGAARPSASAIPSAATSGVRSLVPRSAPIEPGPPGGRLARVAATLESLLVVVVAAGLLGGLAGPLPLPGWSGRFQREQGHAVVVENLHDLGPPVVERQLELLLEGLVALL